MTIRVLGICGSPIKGGNTEAMLDVALEAAQSEKDVKVEKLILAGKKIRDCIHCNYCLSMSKVKEGRPCAIDDDMNEIYFKMIPQDMYMFATPVYIYRMTGLLACFIDRLRAFGHGGRYHEGINHEVKVFVAMAVSWFRGGGLETTCQMLNATASCYDWITVGAGMRGIYGGQAFASYDGAGEFVKEDKLGVLKDKYGLDSARVVAKKGVRLAKLIAAGKRVWVLKGRLASRTTPCGKIDNMRANKIIDENLRVW